MVDGGRWVGVGSGGTDLACTEVRFGWIDGSADSGVRDEEGIGVAADRIAMWA